MVKVKRKKDSTLTNTVLIKEFPDLEHYERDVNKLDG